MEQTPARILLALPENQRAVIHLDNEAAVKVGPRTFRKRILRYGKWSHPNAPGGVLDVDLAYGQKLAANFANGVWDASPVTLGHPTTEAEAVKNATGGVQALEADADGVWATFSVNAPTADKIDAKEIIGCSAGLIPSYVDHEVGGKGDVGPVLEHLALTNRPYIKGLGDFSPVHLADHGDAVLLSLHTEPQEDKPMERSELLTKAKEAGIDIEALEQAAAKVPTLEADLATAKATPTAPTEEAITAAKAEATSELVAALGEGLVGAGHIALSEGEKPTLAGVVGAIIGAISDGKTAQATLVLSEAEAAVDAAIAQGKALPASKDALVKVFLSDKDTFAALIPAEAIVSLGELGHAGSGVNLSDPNSATGGIDTAAEIDRLAALAETV